MPPDAGLYDPGLLKPAESLAQGWVGADPGRTGELPPTASPADMEGWLSDLKLAFVIKLAQLAADCPLHSTATRGIDRLYGLGAIRDPEVSSRARLLECVGAELANVRPPLLPVGFHAFSDDAGVSGAL